jgi:hypothetical protein
MSCNSAPSNYGLLRAGGTRRHNHHPEKKYGNEAPRRSPSSLRRSLVKID